MIEVLRKVEMEQNINCSLKCRKEIGRRNLCFVFGFLHFTLCVHKHAMGVRGQLVEVDSFYHMGSTYRLSGLAASIFTH